MSFLDEQKEEIMSMQYKSCCRYAQLYGILFSKAAVIDDEISLSLESSRVAQYTSQLIKELFMKDALIHTSSQGGRRRTLSFDSPAAKRYLSSLGCGKEYFNENCKNI